MVIDFVLLCLGDGVVVGGEFIRNCVIVVEGNFIVCVIR